MKFKNKYRIESARLRFWDYASSGWYFVTVCTKNKENFFGDVNAGEMYLSEIGKILQGQNGNPAPWGRSSTNLNQFRRNESVVQESLLSPGSLDSMTTSSGMRRPCPE